MICEEELKIKIDNRNDIFSYSKLSTFLQCPYRYNKKYIEHIKSEKQSVESYMGSQVHVCLEKLYNERLNLTNLRRLYDEKFPLNRLPDSVFIVREGEYRENGKKLLSDYYDEYYLNDDSFTLDTEYEIKGEIANREFIGYIDRLSISKDLDNLIINDYKTGKTFKKLKNDLQAKIYTKLLKDKINLPIVNKWYYLRYLKCEEIEFSDDQLKEGEKEIKDIIDRIESEKEFKKRKSPLCQWCEIKEICEKENE